MLVASDRWNVHHQTSARARPPGPRGVPLVGQLLAFRRDPTGFLQDLARRHGDLVRFRLGSRTIYLLNHPDLIEDALVTRAQWLTKSRGLERARPIVGNGLLTSEGEFHLRQRRLCQPAFHRARLAVYARAFVDHAERETARWEDGANLDIARAMTRLTMAIVAWTLFRVDVEAEASEIGEALETALAWQGRRFYPFYDLLARLPLPSNRRFREAMERLDRTIHRVIDEGRRGGEERGDLLSILLRARDEEGDGRGMSEEQLRDEAMTVFLAGHGTIAHALTWTWHLLSMHPEAQGRLHAELDRVLGGRVPTPEDADRLDFTRRVFAESMRLYPPAWLLGRRAASDYPVGDYCLPRGSTIFLCPYVTHRDPRFFPRPEAFDPDRWTPEAEAVRPRYAYFPFGGGNRVCIGEAFAWLEGVLVLACVARRWRVRPAPGVRVRMEPRLTLGPRGGLRVLLEARRG
ncbi:MAG: cytochrome P450 [Planctomycetes bacterium]|nr:cytochrome P450 [Planctomycetota bacterium]